MTKHMNDLLSSFRSLDAAPAQELDEQSRIRAEARLEQIIASDPAQVNTKIASPRERFARPGRRVAMPIAVAAIAVVTATAVLWPGTGATDAAYASWTAVPSEVSSADRAVAESACQSKLDLPSSQLDMAERRGEWVVLLFTGADNMAGMCLAHLPAGASHADHVDTAQGGGDQGFFPEGSEFTQGNISQFNGRSLFGMSDRPGVSLTHGNVGPEVSGVTLTTPDGKTVEASVNDGRYSAWWPGIAFGTDTEGNGGQAPAISYTLTLTDDTVIENAIPRKPS